MAAKSGKGGKAHSWTVEDDVLICYLALHGDDSPVDENGVAQYVQSHSTSGKSLEQHLSAVKMRKQNCAAVLSGGSGSSKASKQTVQICTEWQAKSQEEHKAKCMEILGQSSQGEGVASAGDQASVTPEEKAPEPAPEAKAPEPAPEEKAPEPAPEPTPEPVAEAKAPEKPPEAKKSLIQGILDSIRKMFS